MQNFDRSTTLRHSLGFGIYLGLTFDASMDWHEHINNISNKVTRRLNLLGNF